MIFIKDIRPKVGLNCMAGKSWDSEWNFDDYNAQWDVLFDLYANKQLALRLYYTSLGPVIEYNTNGNTPLAEGHTTTRDLKLNAEIVFEWINTLQS